jgi:hypothetical protein
MFKTNNHVNKFNMKKFTLIFAMLTMVSIVLTAQTQLSWQFANVEVINAGTQLQFDVEVRADAATTYHRDLQVYFDYNTAGFGSDIVANGFVTVTPLALMNTHYVLVNSADNTGSKFAVITEASNEMTQSGSATYFNAMPTTFTGLLRITIDILDNTETAGIVFDAALMNGGQYWQSASTFDPIKYTDPSVYSNDLSALALGTIYGTITYANVTSDPIASCLVDGGLIGSALTDVNGDYGFSNVSDGVYALTTTCSLPYTYTTDVGDANVLINHILATPLTGVFFLAGDVDANATIDVSDVNLMINNILGSAFGYPGPDWVFENQSATVTGGIGTVSYQGLMIGDADGSN